MKLLQNLREHPVKWSLYLILSLVAVSLESGDELLTLVGIGDCNRVTVPAKMLYQRFVTASYRKPRPHSVRLITLSSLAEPKDVLANPCKKREFVGAILRKVADVCPSVVVLDLWYSPEVCKGGDDALRAETLNGTITDLAAHLPIVVATNSETLEELELNQDPEVQQLKQTGLTRKDQIVDAYVQFGGEKVSYGLARLNCDSRRIPLLWSVYPGREAVQKGTIREPTLSYEAATKADHALTAVLKKILTTDQHPFTSFVAESEFDPIHGIQVVCGRTLKSSEEWQDCQTGGSFDISSLRGKVVIIGELSDRDNHESVIGNVPGYVLHANYLESLLDDRYLSPVNPFLEFAFTALGIVIIVVLFEFSSSLVRGFVYAALFVTSIVAICNVVSMYLGVFLVFWLPLVVVPIIEFFFGGRVRSRPDEKPVGTLPEPP